MKNSLLILLLVSFLSCKENTTTAQDKKPEETVNSQKLDDEIQQIGNLYQPEKIVAKQNKIRTDNKNEDYKITLTNSDSLDTDIKNLQKHAEKIVRLYYKNLSRNIVPLNCNEILIEIEHRNGEKDSFKFTEKDINKGK